jgi:hypothetical protein
MTIAYRLIVTDTSPLFTLVLADALDALIRPSLPVDIPDADSLEATQGARCESGCARRGDAVCNWFSPCRCS